MTGRGAHKRILDEVEHAEDLKLVRQLSKRFKFTYSMLKNYLSGGRMVGAQFLGQLTASPELGTTSFLQLFVMEQKKIFKLIFKNLSDRKRYL